MIDKKTIKQSLNDRLKEIDFMVDQLKPHDTINDIIDKYSEELSNFHYIDSVELFSTLPLKGVMRYVGRYDKKLRYGGLLVKIYQKDGEWYGVIKQKTNKKYYVSFKSNYIFYLEGKEEATSSFMKALNDKIDSGFFIIE